jgi:hypothetical protein
MSWREIGVELDGASEERLRLGVLLRREAVQVPQAALVVLPRVQVLGRLAVSAFALDAAEGWLDGGDDCVCYLVLDGEDILEIAVVAFGPEVIAGGRFDELGGNPHPVAEALGVSRGLVKEIVRAGSDYRPPHLPRFGA